jgi:hypothetical protein
MAGYAFQDYFDVIKQPMDLSTIESKLKSRKYHSGSECIADFDLIFQNCYTYNRPGDVRSYICGFVLEFFGVHVCSLRRAVFGLMSYRCRPSPTNRDDWLRNLTVSNILRSCTYFIALSLD